MISYKEYFSNEIFDLIKNKSYLKEMYKLKFNVDKVPILYIQQIKDVVLYNYPNSNVFLVLNDGVPIGYTTGSVSGNKFILNDPIISNKYINKGIEQKLVLRTISTVKSKIGVSIFKPSMLSTKVKFILKEVLNKKIKKSKVSPVIKKNIFSKLKRIKFIKKK